MPSTIKCPHCQATLETDLQVGQALRCPSCKERFRIDRSTLVSDPNALSNHKLLIPLGYVAFVGVPLVLTIVFVLVFFKPKPAEEQKEEPQQVAKSDSRTSTNHEPKKTPKRGPPPRRPQDNDVPEAEVATPNTTPVKGMPADTQPTIPPKSEATPKNEITPKAEITPKTETTTPMPAIPEQDASQIAPVPREVLWKIPVTGYTSDWQKVGDVHVRVGGLAITKAHFIDSKANTVESPSPFLVAIVEVRKGDAKKSQTLLSWTYFRTHYAAIFMKDDKELRPGEVPAGSKLQSKLEKQTIPDDGTPVRDILLFSVPADDAGELNLRLDAERCGEKGDIWFKIPPLAWKKQ
jgi:hypothetical protein